MLAWTDEGAWGRFAGPVTRLIPERTLVGYHVCYGTFPEWPMYQAQRGPALRRRHQTASRYLDDFGVAMYCGFGRQPGQDGDETMRGRARVQVAAVSALRRLSSPASASVPPIASSGTAGSR